MQVALIVVTFLFAAGIIGSFLKPNADQLRPLEPQPSSGEASHDSHH